MDAKEILKLAETENKSDEAETRVALKGGAVAELVTLIAGLCLFLLEWFLKKEIAWSLLSLALISCGVQCVYEGISFHKKGQWILGILSFILSILFAIMTVLS